MKVGIIGTGLMGYPMAINIAKKFSLFAFNRSYEKAKNLRRFNIDVKKKINDLITSSKIIITMLPSDKEVLQIVKKIKDFAKPNTIVIDMSSTRVSTAKKVYKDLKKKKIYFLDAPVSGGPEGAKNAKLAIMVGGDSKTFRLTKSLLQTMGTPTLVGPNGSGQVSKLCNQIIVSVTTGGVAEAIALCEKSGVKSIKFIEAVAGGFADSKILQNHGRRMIKRDFKARGKNITYLKDLDNILKSAKGRKVRLRLSRLMQNSFKHLCDKGLANEDSCSLYKLAIEN